MMTLNLNNFQAHPVGDTFTGIRISNKSIDFFYPETFRLSPIEDSYNFRNDIIAILSSIGLAKSIESPTKEIESSFADNQDFSIISYLWILNDYYKNGIWTNKTTKYREGQFGKINWKRTLQQPPFISNGRIVYPNSIVETTVSFNDILSEIHKYCVKSSVDFLGWLYNIRCDFSVDKISAKKKKEYSYILHKELGKTFQDEKRTRLSHMLKIIDGINTDNQSKEIVYGVSSYHYVFERMVDAVFGNQDDLSEFYPQAYWMLEDVNKQEGSSLRPDTVRIVGKKAYIFDSKYYMFGKLPTTSDIQKQITYAEYLENQKGYLYSPIKNAFILPYDKSKVATTSEENNRAWKYIGYAKTDWKKDTEQGVQPSHYIVYGYYIDTTDLIHRYRNSWDDVVTSLVLDLSRKDAKTVEPNA